MRSLIAIPMAAMLAGCAEKPPSPVNRGVCEVPPDAAEWVGPDDGGLGRDRGDACIHNRAYLLASAAEPASVVAKAIVAACRPQIEQHQLSAGITAANGGANNAQQGTIRNAIESDYEGQALYRVIQARVGHCWDKR